MNPLGTRFGRTPALVAVLAVLLLVGFVAVAAATPPILEETFPYSLGNLSGQGGWTAYSQGGTNPIQVVSPALTYGGYPLSDVGNAASLISSGEDLYKTFTPQSSGSVYCSFLAKFTSATSYDNFFQLQQSPYNTSLTYGYCRVYFGLPVGDGRTFIVNKSNYTSAYYDPAFVYQLDQTILVVVKYTFNPGTDDDVADFWFDPVIGESEPVPSITHAIGADAPHIGCVALRQGTAGRITDTISGIRVGTSWADVVMTPLPPAVSAATQVTANGFTANWGAVAGATGYRLDVATDAGFTSFVPGYQDLAVSGLSQAVSGLASATAYYYRVRSVVGASPSANSATQGVQTAVGPPVALAATELGSSGFTANWSAVGSATGYRLDVATDYGFSSFVPGYQDLAVPGLSQPVTGLAEGTTCYYRVRAVGPGGTSGNSNVITVTTLGTGVYAWAGGGGGAWNVAGSWSPARTVPSTADVLLFNGGGSVTVTGVPTETIGRLLLTGGTTVNLQAGAANTLTIGGGAGSDLDVPTGCALNVSSANALKILLGAGATGSVSGSMTFSGGTHKLDATDAGGLTFASGALFTQATGCTGNVFTNAGTANAVVFASGATFVCQAGANPFGLTQPASKVVFQAGSLYRHEQTGSPSLSGRTYADFQLNAAGYNATALGGSPFVVDDLTITQGAMQLQLTNIAIRGDITVAPGQTLAFNPTAAAAIALSGSAPQTIANAGTLSFGSLATVTVSNAHPSGATATGSMSWSSSGTITVSAGSRLALGSVFANAGTMNVNGSLQLDAGGGLAGNAPVYGGVSSLVYSAGGAVGPEWGAGTAAGTGVPQGVIVQGGTVTMPGSPRSVPGVLSFTGGAMALTDGGDLTVRGALALDGGRITTTAATKVVLPAGVSLTRTTGYVAGNLQKHVGEGPQVLDFELGDTAGRYSPATVAFNDVATAGELVATVTPGMHPNLGGSEVSAERYVNRYWTLTNSGVAFDNCSATLQFVPADLVGIADPTKLVAGKRDGGTWTYPTVGTRTATSTQVTGLTSFSDLVLGMPACHEITLSPPTLPGGAVGVSYSQTLSASGGTAPYRYYRSSGSLPPGLTLVTLSGELVGTPTTAGPYTFTVAAYDDNDCIGYLQYTVTISAAFSITTASPLPGGTVGTVYSATLAASGGTPPYGNWQVIAGALPAGLSLTPATGVIGGTPTAVGTASFTVQVSDAASATATKAFSLSVSCPAITVLPASLPGGAVGTAYSQAITASGGSTPHAFTVTAGALPAGLSLAGDGTLAGTPSTEGTYSFTVTATDSYGCTGARAYFLGMVVPQAVACPGTTPTPNGAQVSTRIWNDCPASDLTVTNNYPAQVRFAETWSDCFGFANLHAWSFSADGGASRAAFENCSAYSFGADLTLSGDGDGEAGLRLSPWWSPDADGKFMVRAFNGEIACFGGRLPFYSFTGMHGITYTVGTPIHLGIVYAPHELSPAEPATVTYEVVYGGNSYTSGPLPFDQGAPEEAAEHGVWGELTPAYAGGYFQPYAGSGTPATLTASWDNIGFTKPQAAEPTAPATALAIGAVGPNAMTVGWTNGDGARRLVVAKAGSAVSGTPTDGTSYTAAAFGSGGTVAAGEYVVYSGTGSTVEVTGLAAATTYHFAVFEFNGSGGSENYLTTSPATGSQATEGATYAWTGFGDMMNWGDPLNWEPQRDTPATTDVMLFDGVAPVTVDVPAAQTIGRLLLANGSAVTLRSGSSTANTLVIAGGPGPDLLVPAGCSLTLSAASSTRTLTIALGDSATGAVGGSVAFTGPGTATANKLVARGTNALVFQGGATCTAGPYFGSYPFGSGTAPSALNSVVFESGSSFIQKSGSNPFGPTGVSVTTFQHGSLYSFQVSLAPTLSGRTYADFEIAGNAVALVDWGWSGVCAMDRLEVRSGSQLKFIWGGTTGTPNGTFNLKRGLVVDGLLTFGASDNYGFAFVGPDSQSISGGGTIDLPANLSGVTVNDSAGVYLRRDLTVNCPLVYTAGTITVMPPHAMTLNGAVSGMGSENYAIGSLTQPVPTGATSQTFAVGDDDSYMPLTLDFGNVSAAGSLTVTNTEATQPNLGLSLIDPEKMVGSYWTIANNGTAFDSYCVTFNFTAAELGGADPDKLVVGKYDAGAWTYPPVTERTSTSLKVCGLTSFSDFVLGEMVSHTITASAGSNGTIDPAGAVSVAHGASQSFTITPAPDYAVQDVRVDDVSVGAVTSYPFTNVTTDHTIAASFMPAHDNRVAAVGTTICITPIRPCLTVPVNIARSEGTDLRGFHVDFTLSPELKLCGAGTSGVAEGTYLSNRNPNTTFLVVDNGGGSYTADGTINGLPCGQTALTGNLFNLEVGSNGGSGTGTITVTDVALRDCDNADILPASAGAPATVTFDATPVTIADVPDQTVAELGSLTITPSATITACATGPATWGISPSLPGGATFSTSSGEIAWTPDCSQAGSYGPYTLTATAASGESDTEPFSILVTDTPGGVTVTGVTSPYAVEERSPLAMAPPGVTLTGCAAGRTPVWSLTGTLPSGASFSTTTGQVTWTPDCGQAGTYGPYTLTATVTAVGGQTYSGSETFSITATHKAGLVTVTGVSDPTVAELATATMTLGATLGECATGPVTYGVSPALPGWANLAGNLITIAPDCAAAEGGAGGTYGPYTVAATAGTAETGTATFSIHVTDTPGGVAVTGVTSPYTVEEKSALAMAVPGVDLTGCAAGMTPVWSLVGTLPGGLSFSSVTGQITGSPDCGTAATYGLTLTATVVNGAETYWGSVPVQIVATHKTGTVTVAAIATPQTVAEMASLTITPSAELTDCAALPLTWSVSTGTLPAWAGFVPGTGVITLAPGCTDAGSYGPFALKATASTSEFGYSNEFSITVTDVPVAIGAPTGVTAVQVRSGNAPGDTTGIVIGFTAPSGGVSYKVYRAPFGHYPEYDDAGGVAPTAPTAYPPGAPWVETLVTASGGTDIPPARDHWYYVVCAVNSCGDVSVPSAMTSGTLDYHLGDVSDGYVHGLGNNLVAEEDVSELGAHYGLTLAHVGDLYNYLDVGPTTTHLVSGRPLTDDKVNFEDMMIFAMNFGMVTISGTTALPPLAAMTQTPAATDALVLRSPDRVAVGEPVTVPLRMQGTGLVQGVSLRLGWDATVVEPVGQAAGELLLALNGVALSPEPGVVDVAVLGEGRGITGEGTLATVSFRVIANGDPAIRIESVEARDTRNEAVALNATREVMAPALPTVTALSFAQPNPFRDNVTLAFSLAEPGPVDLRIYSVDGRLVRTLVSGTQEPGYYRPVWDGRDDRGHPMSAGVFYARLVAGKVRITRTMSYLR